MEPWITFLNERDPPDVGREPRVKLGPWRIFRSISGHFYIGLELQPGTLRLTSAVSRMDYAGAVATTSSGREYQFREPPTTETVRAMITANALRRGLHGATDVSDLWWRAIAQGPDTLRGADLTSVLPPSERDTGPDALNPG